ncbi:MAG TPA: SPFH domain-containing protein [Spirochaetia bacterium]|nr:SPFH domain-containing protein [Spirochaetia bacterium]
MDIIQSILHSGGPGLVGGLIGVGAFILFISILKSIIKVTNPDRILVVTGRKRAHNGREFGFSVERGRTVKVPYFQSVQSLDIGVYPISVRVEGVNSANGITVGADATACVCINDDDEGMLYSAVERLMGKDREQIQEQIQQTLVGNFRGALTKATPLQAIGMAESYEEEGNESDASQAIEQGERAQFRAELLKDIDSDLSTFGMRVVSVSLQKIWDTSNYIANLAQKTLAQKRQQVEIEEARLRAIADKAESDSARRTTVAKNKADEKILASQEKLEVYRREAQGSVDRARLEADHAIEEAQNRGESLVQEQLVQLQKLKNQTGVTLKAQADESSAETIASGEQESVNIIESTRNDLLRQKVEMLRSAGQAGKLIVFVQQQLPNLFEAFKKYAIGLDVDSLVMMDDEKGFNGAVNRGPAAFVDFLQQFSAALGVDVREFIGTPEARLRLSEAASAAAAAPGMQKENSR